MRKKVKIGGLDFKEPRIAVTLAGITPKLLKTARIEGADIIELRADKMKKPAPARIIKALDRIRKAGFPSILTIMNREEGAERHIPDKKRLLLFRQAIKAADAVDIEYFSRDIRDAVIKLARRNRKTVIVSFHALDSTPSDFLFGRVLKLAFQKKADIVKIAAMANTFDDMVRLSSFTYDNRNKNIITLSLGQVGRTSRVIFPSLGSIMTYGFVDRPQAPGQMRVSFIKRLLSA